MSRTVIHPDMRCLFILTGLAAWSGRQWIYPSHKYICHRMERLYGRSMSVRTLCRHLAALERDGWIRRTRRIRTEKGKGMVFRSTLYRICSQSRSVLRAAVDKYTRSHTWAAAHIRSSRLTDTANNRRSSHRDNSLKPPQPVDKSRRSSSWTKAATFAVAEMANK